MAQSDIKKYDGKGFELSILDFNAEFEKMFRNFNDSEAFRSNMQRFDKMENGVLLYNWTEGSGHERFVIVEQIGDDYFRSETVSGAQKFQRFKNERMSALLQKLENRNYYEWTQNDLGHANYSFFTVKRNGKLWSAYLAPKGKSGQQKAYGDINFMDMIKLIELVDKP